MQVEKLTIPEEFVQADGAGRKLRAYCYVPAGYKEPGVHRVEFIIWHGYWICNAQINGVWHTTEFPNYTSMAEFLAEGQINKAIHWPRGRKYTKE